MNLEDIKDLEEKIKLNLGIIDLKIDVGLDMSTFNIKYVPKSAIKKIEHKITILPSGKCKSNDSKLW